MPESWISQIIKTRRWDSIIAIVSCTVWLTSQVWRVQSQLDQSWTVHMQADWGRLVANHNTNNWIPNAYTIYYNNRQGRPIDAKDGERIQ